MVAVLLFGFQQVSNAQNWGFSLPFGIGGFAINGKNWTAGYNGAVAGGGPSGWGFGLPNGAGFYNGNGGGGRCGGFPIPYNQSRGSVPYVASGGPGAPYNPTFVPNQAPPGLYGGYGPGPSRNYIRRSVPTAYTSGWVSYPNGW